MYILFNRYEGARNAEALAEFVNKEGGTLPPSFIILVAKASLMFSHDL